MAERELYLLERGVTFVRELRKCAAQVMRRDVQSQIDSVTTNDVEHRLRGHAFAGNPVSFVHRP